MATKLQNIKEEVAAEFIKELKSEKGKESLWNQLTRGVLAQAFLDSLAKKEPFGVDRLIINSKNKDVEEALNKAEEKIGRALNASVDSDGDNNEDETKGTSSEFPNLKYAKPKYKNVESILKYMESKEDKGSVRIVIMNFND